MPQRGYRVALILRLNDSDSVAIVGETFLAAMPVAAVVLINCPCYAVVTVNRGARHHDHTSRDECECFVAWLHNQATEAILFKPDVFDKKPSRKLFAGLLLFHPGSQLS